MLKSSYRFVGAHADRRVNAMDRLTDDVINELIQLCLPHWRDGSTRKAVYMP